MPTKSVGRFLGANRIFDAFILDDKQFVFKVNDILKGQRFLL